MSFTVTAGSTFKIDLNVQEGFGGHTIAQHIAKTHAWLQTQLLNDLTISAATAFPNLMTAENAVNDAIQANIFSVSELAYFLRNHIRFHYAYYAKGHLVSRDYRAEEGNAPYFLVPTIIVAGARSSFCRSIFSSWWPW
jgi:hypothetical protein